MKKLIASLLTLTQFLLTAPASAALSQADYSNFPTSVQLLLNPGFESSTAKWTASAGTFTTQSSTLFAGNSSASWVVASSGATLSQDVTPTQPLSGVNLEASCWVNTAATNVQVCAREAGASLGSTYCQSVPSTGTWQYIPVNFVGPSSGSVGVEVTTTSSTSATAYVDQCYVGKATNLSQVSQAQQIGQVKITGCSTNWSSTATSLSPFTAQSGCTYTTSGAALAPSTNIPAIKFASLPPGNYVLKYEGTLDATYISATASAIFQFSDGTNLANETSFVGNGTSTAAQIIVPGVQQTISYTTPQSNVTLQLESYVLGSGQQSQLYGTTSFPGVITVYYYPSQSQLAKTTSVTPANWSGISTLTGTTTSTSPADPGSVSGSVTTVASQNISCTAASSLVGITCTLPSTGIYQACFGGYAYNSVTGDESSEFLADGSNNAITGLQTQGAVAGISNTFSQCGNYNATSTSVTFKLRGEVQIGGTSSFFPTTFSVTSLNTPTAAPIFVGSNTSTGSGQYHSEAASLLCSSSSSIVSQTGSWISSIANISSGCCSVTVTPGEFSTAPVIVGNAATTSAASQVFNGNSTNSTSFTVCGTASVTGSSLTSWTANVNAMGAH